MQVPANSRERHVSLSRQLFEWLLLGTNGATIGLCDPMTKPETLLIGPFEEEAGGGDDDYAAPLTPNSGLAVDPADSIFLMVRLRIRFKCSLYDPNGGRFGNGGRCEVTFSIVGFWCCSSVVLLLLFSLVGCSSPTSPAVVLVDVVLGDCGPRVERNGLVCLA